MIKDFEKKTNLKSIDKKHETIVYVCVNVHLYVGMHVCFYTEQENNVVNSELSILYSR